MQQPLLNLLNFTDDFNVVQTVNFHVLYHKN